jgi:hypothetical protein
MMETPNPTGPAEAPARTAPPTPATPQAPETPLSPASDPDPIGRRAQFLTTEHWSLLATRSMSWNEAFSRTSMFLSVLSASTVALALAGPAMAFGEAFSLFAVIVLSVALFLGVATYVRLVQVNNEDLYWVTGMNMIRRQYAKMSPGVERSFVTGYTLDVEGIARTFAAFDVTSNPSMIHALITTPSIVAVISSTIAGVIVGLISHVVSGNPQLAVTVGIGVAVVGIGLSLAYGRRQSRHYIARAIEMRLPGADAVDGDPTPHVPSP